MHVAEHVAGTALPNHAHRDSRLVVVLEGAFDERIEGRTRHCPASTVILRAAGEEHDDRFRAPRTRYASMSVSGVASSTTLSASPLTLRLAHVVGDETRSRALMRKILEQIICHEPIDPRVRFVREHIEHRFASHIRIRNLARETELHPATLARAFRAAYGCNPWELVLFTRVRAAMRAIAHGDQSFATIALRCGFYDQSHFSNAFRRITGMSPGAYVRASLPSKT